jgi:hypothetical protein
MHPSTFRSFRNHQFIELLFTFATVIQGNLSPYQGFSLVEDRNRTEYPAQGASGGLRTGYVVPPQVHMGGEGVSSTPLCWGVRASNNPARSTITLYFHFSSFLFVYFCFSLSDPRWHSEPQTSRCLPITEQDGVRTTIACGYRRSYLATSDLIYGSTAGLWIGWIRSELKRRGKTSFAGPPTVSNW